LQSPLSLKVLSFLSFPLNLFPSIYPSFITSVHLPRTSFSGKCSSIDLRNLTFPAQFILQLPSQQQHFLNKNLLLTNQEEIRQASSTPVVLKLTLITCHFLQATSMICQCVRCKTVLLPNKVHSMNYL
jgi:hypothetical protein